MQTFLPYKPIQNDDTGEWSFANCAEVLDKKRLNKQVLEASQILDILCGRWAKPTYANHPAVLQWKGHEWVLLDYLTDMANEARAKKIACSIFDRLGGYIMLMPGNASQDPPEWMNEMPEVFASHRSRLLFKGRCDSAIEALKTIVKPPKGITIRYWLLTDECPLHMSNDYVKTRQMKHSDVEQIEDFLYKYHVQIAPNFYRQYKWKETDTIPYVWPVTIAAIREQAMREKEKNAAA